MTWRLLFAVAAALLAVAKKRNAILWFIAGFMFTWFALIIILILPGGSGRRIFVGGEHGRARETRWRRRVSRSCPYCGSHVTFDDIPGNWTCPNCGQTFTYSSDGHVFASNKDELMPQMELMVKLFAKMAKKDGVVSENEVRQVDQIVREAFRPTKEQLRKIMTLFNGARYSDEPFETIAHDLYASVRGRGDVLTDTIIALLAIAASDGALRTEEEAMIRSAASIFGLADQYESIKAQFFGRQSYSSEEGSSKIGLEACYRLLGCTPNDSDQLIKKKYRELIKENHPDRLMSRGASEATIKEANSKVTRIKHAYEQIMAARS
ncbi:TerB family tellurite resistance protein [Sporolactobacillus shoreicorticis]|uniref:TerB family tellurite resistance protein n=1 Tax=Sporolactobacillus shoreicorticis TaxID=1923877 RepID=A0ABW5S7G6_9BACL|nr:TerB family tellurite resistance protein [Sporolactobacillus shoreicorticis]MCO7125466.1 TerB family tellurite resistance protein [Sporolactobacillus shoreicorticis]